MQYVLQERQAGETWTTVDRSESFRSLNRKKTKFDRDEGGPEYRVVPESQALKEEAAEEAASTPSTVAQEESDEPEEVRWLLSVCS